MSNEREYGIVDLIFDVRRWLNAEGIPAAAQQRLCERLPEGPRQALAYLVPPDEPLTADDTRHAQLIAAALGLPAIPTADPS